MLPKAAVRLCRRRRLYFGSSFFGGLLKRGAPNQEAKLADPAVGLRRLHQGELLPFDPPAGHCSCIGRFERRFLESKRAFRTASVSEIALFRRTRLTAPPSGAKSGRGNGLVQQSRNLPFLRIRYAPLVQSFSFNRLYSKVTPRSFCRTSDRSRPFQQSSTCSLDRSTKSSCAPAGDNFTLIRSGTDSPGLQFGSKRMSRMVVATPPSLAAPTIPSTILRSPLRKSSSPPCRAFCIRYFSEKVVACFMLFSSPKARIFCSVFILKWVVLGSELVNPALRIQILAMSPPDQHVTTNGSVL